VIQRIISLAYLLIDTSQKKVLSRSHAWLRWIRFEIMYVCGLFDYLSHHVCCFRRERILTA